jgi:hypothetical protein
MSSPPPSPSGRGSSCPLPHPLPEGERDRRVGQAQEGCERQERHHQCGRHETPGRASEGQSLRLSARDAGNEAILAWLSEQGVRLEALGDELGRAGCKMHGKQASVPSPVSRGTVPQRNAGVLQVADMGSAARQEAAPARC